MKPEYREAVVKRLTRIVADPSSSPREIASASRTLATIEAQNQADEQFAAKTDAPQVNVQVNLGEVRRELLGEAAYIESLRQQALTHADEPPPGSNGHHPTNGHAGVVRANGKPGPLGNGSPPGPSG